MVKTSISRQGRGDCSRSPVGCYSPGTRVNTHTGHPDLALGESADTDAHTSTCLRTPRGPSEMLTAKGRGSGTQRVRGPAAEEWTGVEVGRVMQACTPAGGRGITWKRGGERPGKMEPAGTLAQLPDLLLKKCLVWCQRRSLQVVGAS